jgi:transposase
MERIVGISEAAEALGVARSTLRRWEASGNRGSAFMILAHKIALDPNDKQRSYFRRASGTARFAYNWALGEWRRQYQAGEKPSEVSLRRQLNALKREQYRWMFDVTKCAAQEAVIDLGAAFFLRNIGRSLPPGG